MTEDEAVVISNGECFEHIKAEISANYYEAKDRGWMGFSVKLPHLKAERLCAMVIEAERHNSEIYAPIRRNMEHQLTTRKTGDVCGWEYSFHMFHNMKMKWHAHLINAIDNCSKELMSDGEPWARAVFDDNGVFESLELLQGDLHDNGK